MAGVRGEARVGDRGEDTPRAAQPQEMPGVPAVPGLAEPGTFPTPRRIEEFLLTISPTGWDRRGYFAESLAKGPKD